jgi:hypothetical protein
MRETAHEHLEATRKHGIERVNRRGERDAPPEPDRENAEERKSRQRFRAARVDRNSAVLR